MQHRESKIPLGTRKSSAVGSFEKLTIDGRNTGAAATFSKKKQKTVPERFRSMSYTNLYFSHVIRMFLVGGKGSVAATPATSTSNRANYN